MNKTAIKNFAVWARRKLIADITIKAGRLSITENGIAGAGEITRILKNPQEYYC